MCLSKPSTTGRWIVRTTNRIRAAASLIWLGLALANHARAVDLRDWGRKYDNANERSVVLSEFNNDAVLDKETQLAAVPAVAADGTGGARRVRFDGEHLSLHVERMPFDELLAALGRSGRVRVDLQGDPSSVTVSDSFDGMDVAQALRRVLSTHSHLLIDRGPHERTPRIIGLILLASQAGERSGAGPGTDQSATDSAPGALRGAQSPADV